MISRSDRSTLPSQKLRALLPDTIEQALTDNFKWCHDEIQRELDNLVAEAHDALYDLSKIPVQQDKATVLSTDTSIFQLIPRSKVLQVPNEASSVSSQATIRKDTAQVYTQVLPQCGSQHRKLLRSPFGLTRLALENLQNK